VAKPAHRAEEGIGTIPPKLALSTVAWVRRLHIVCGVLGNICSTWRENTNVASSPPVFPRPVRRGRF